MGGDGLMTDSRHYKALNACHGDNQSAKLGGMQNTLNSLLEPDELGDNDRPENKKKMREEKQAGMTHLLTKR